MLDDREVLHRMGLGFPAKRSQKPSFLGPRLRRTEGGSQLVAGFVWLATVVIRRVRASQVRRMAMGHWYKFASAGRIVLLVVEKQLVTHWRTLFQKVDRRAMADLVGGKAPTLYRRMGEMMAWAKRGAL